MCRVDVGHREIQSNDSAVLHYVYNKYSDLKNRRDRCDCAPTEEDTRRCFMLPFDREVFLKFARSLKLLSRLLSKVRS